MDTVAGRARALSDPTRLRLALALHGGGEVCGCDLAWIVERSPTLVSHHLATLRRAGVSETRREGRVVFHRLTAAGEGLLDVLGVTAA